MTYQRNYVREGLEGDDEFDRRPSVDEDDDPILKEIDFYKQRLYKKIDGCFVRYGLEGLKKIDEGIAVALDKYIRGLRGEVVEEPAQRPVVREAAQSTPRPQASVAPQRPDNFKKPVRVTGPAPMRSTQPPAPGVFNTEIINKVLNDIIPPTEIHEVQIHSNIPVDQIMAKRNQAQKVDFAPQPQMAEAIEGDEMVEVGNEEAGSQMEPMENLSPVVQQAVEAPAQVASVEQLVTSPTSTYHGIGDYVGAGGAGKVDLLAGTNYDYQPGQDDGGDELMGGEIEVKDETPIDVPAAPRKPRKKKTQE